MSRAIFVDLCAARDDAASSSLSRESQADHCDALIERIFNANQQVPRPERVEVRCVNLERVKYRAKLTFSARERNVQLARMLIVHEILYSTYTIDECKTRASGGKCTAPRRSCWLALQV